MKKDKQLYVHRCIKNCNFCGKRYKKGDYVTYEGGPTKNINEANIATLEQYNLIDPEEYGDPLDFLFEQIPINVMPQIIKKSAKKKLTIDLDKMFKDLSKKVKKRKKIVDAIGKKLNGPPKSFFDGGRFGFRWSI